MKPPRSRLLCMLLPLVCCTPVSSALAQQTVPLAMEPLFQLNPTSAEDLSTQTRHFSTADRETVFFAAASVLQDMGFKVAGGERQFGFLAGEKTTDVPGAGVAHAVAEAALVTVTVLLSIAVGEDLVTDLPEQVAQRIHVSLLVSASGDDDGGVTEVRVSLDRDMIYDHGGIIPDHTELPLVYQEFFAKLSRSVYLEEEQL